MKKQQMKNLFSIKSKLAITASIVLAPLYPGHADSGGAVLFNSSSIAKDIPSQLKRSQSEHYRAIFKAIDDNQWDQASKLIENAPDNPLKPIAKAELFLAANSPRFRLGLLLCWVKKQRNIRKPANLVSWERSPAPNFLPNFRNELIFLMFLAWPSG